MPGLDHDSMPLIHGDSPFLPERSGLICGCRSTSHAVARLWLTAGHYGERTSHGIRDVTGA